jgi:capsular exopolysaccharide synthesis family protein
VPAENEIVKILDVRDLLKVLVKRKGIVVVGTLLVVTISTVLSFYVLKPVYEARVLLQVSHPIQPQEGRYLETEGIEGAVNTLSSLPEMTMQTHAFQLHSEALLERVGNKLELKPEQLAGKRLYQMVDVVVVKDSNLLTITVESYKPELAMIIANTISEQYIEFISEMNQSQMERSLVFLEKQHAQASQKLQEILILVNRHKANPNFLPSPEELAQIDYWNSEVERLRKILDVLAEKTIETKIKGSLDFGKTNIMVVSPAMLPDSPVKPDKVLNITVAFLLGLMIFLPLAFLLEHLDYSIKTPEDVEKYLNLPVLGVIPKMKQKKICFNCQDPGSLLGEAYRMLRTNLGFASPQKPCRSLLITSAGPEEGKSTTAANLAQVLAQLGKKVLLVDCDLRKPSQHTIFELKNEQGFVNIVLQEGALTKYIQQAVKGLWVLTSGPMPPNPSEIITLSKTKEFWTKEFITFDYILIDSPPVLPVADPVLLSSQIDGVLLVLESSCRVETALEAESRLSKAGANIVGVVLNKVKLRKTYYSYYN